MGWAMTESDKLAELRAHVGALGSVIVAYSGGVDSALVLAVAHAELGERALGITAVSPSLPAREREAAQALAQQIGARHRFIHSEELSEPRYARNHRDRCFYCKSELYSRLSDIARLEGYAHVANGTNIDDLGDQRPGLAAASAAGVLSPLCSVGLDKAGVRALARRMELPCWDKPAAACLSSRIPYGTQVTQERLRQVEGLEDALLSLGLRQVRVRHHGPLARIEVANAEMDLAFAVRNAIVAAARSAGFTFATLDLAGYQMGSMNSLPVIQ